MDFGLQGKRALVTGGSLGIGKAIALELAREGVDVAIVARTKDRLEAAARELEGQTGRTVIPLVADVSSKEQVDRAVAQAADRLGGLHILVHTTSRAGGMMPIPEEVTGALAEFRGLADIIEVGEAPPQTATDEGGHQCDGHRLCEPAYLRTRRTSSA